MDLVPQAPELPAKEKEVEEDMCPSSSYSLTPIWKRRGIAPAKKRKSKKNGLGKEEKERVREKKSERIFFWRPK